MLALGDVHIEKGNKKLKPYERHQYTRAMALYYSAYNRAATKEQKKAIFKKIEFAEHSFLKSIDIESKTTSTDEIEDYKKILSDLRGWCKEELKTINEKYDITKIENEKEKQPIENQRAEHVRNVQEKIQKTIGNLLTSMITAAIQQIGEPPCKYTIIGFGSFAECRMTPYSDLEFGILVEEETEKNLEYFRNLTELTHLKVIHLGETVLRPMKIASLTDGYFDNSSKNGLKFDSFRYGGCKTPLGSRKEDGTIEFELIHTPKEMAKFQELGHEALEKQHLPIGLFSAEYMTGDEQLLIDYQKGVKTVLESGDKKPYSERGLKILKEDVNNFSIDLFSEYEDGKIYDVKREIYRLSDRVIAALCLYLGIYEPNGWKKIEALISLMGEENTAHLTVIFSVASEVRLRSYLESGEQQEKCLANHIGHLFNKQSPFDIFFRYYYRALALQKEIKKFLAATDKKLRSSIYFDDNLYHQGIIHKKLMRYEKSLACCLDYLKENAKNSIDSKALSMTAFLFQITGDAKQAINYDEQALRICKSTYSDKHPTVAATLNNLGGAYQTLGEAKKAIAYYEQALAIVKEVYGDKHPDVALSLNNLGSAWETLGEAKKAITYYEQALAIVKEVYGDKHPNVAAILSNLGGAWKTLGDAKKAIFYYEQALAIVKEVYGDKHPTVAVKLNNLGGAWKTLGDAKKAIFYYEQALAIDTEVYGDKHPAVALMLNNLGAAFRTLGEAKKAITYYEQALAIVKEMYGDKHPDVALSLNNLGLAWKTLGDAKKAITYYEQALAIVKEVYGDKHPNVAATLNNLGEAFHTLGDAKKAITYYEQALAIDTELYGDKHPNVATRLNNLGGAWETLGDAKKAITYYEQALAIVKEMYGDKHPDVALSLNNLGLAWKTLGDAKKAITYYEQALAIVKEVYGDKHPTVAVKLSNLGGAWKTLGDAKKAIFYYEQALAIVKEVYGDKHPTVAVKLNNLGGAWKTLGDAKKAIFYYEQALAIDTEVYGDKHPAVALMLNNLGAAFRTLGEAKKAITYYEQALAIVKEMYGDKHPDVALSLNNLGLAWKTLGDAKKAITYYEQGLAIVKEVYGDKHPNVALSLNNLGAAFRTLGDAKKAITYYEQALAIDTEVYGDKHPNVATRLNNLGGAWETLGEAKKAITYYEQALAIDTEVYGDKHPNVATRLNNLGAAWETLGEAKKAIAYYEQALAIIKEVYGDKHPNVARTLNNLGGAFRTLGEAKKAIAYYEQALAIDTAVYGDKHPTVARTLNNLGAAWHDYKEHKKAFSYILRAYALQLVYFREYHPHTKTIKTTLTVAASALANQLFLKGERNTAQRYKKFEGIQYKNLNQYYEHAHSNPKKTAILLPIAYAQVLIELAPWESEGYYALAKALLLSAIDTQTKGYGQYTQRVVERVFENMKKALELNSCAHYQAMHAYFRLNQGKYDDAIKQATQLLQSLSQSNITNDIVHFNHIDDHSLLPTFLQSYLSVMKVVDYSAKTWTLLVLISSYQQQKSTKFVKLYLNFLVKEAEKQDKPEDWVLLGYIYQLTGQETEALEVFKKAAKQYQTLKNQAAYEFLLPFRSKIYQEENLNEAFSNLSLSSLKHSTFFSTNEKKFINEEKASKEMPIEWYTQDDINKLLIHYQSLTENDDMDILTCLLGTDITQNNNMLRDNLLDYQKTRMKDKVIIPINLGNAHWVLLYITYPTDNPKLPTIHYIDPLGGDIHTDVKEALHDELLYPGADIHVSGDVFQQDTYNCGAWIVELGRRLMVGEISTEKSDIDIESARENHQKILKDNNFVSFVLKKI